MKIGEIKITIHQDEKGNLTYMMVNSNERGITACYTGKEAIKHIEEMIMKIIIRL